jgi:hypothetical protein
MPAIIAESLVVTDRRTLYTHPQSRAETSVFTISRRDRNRPFSLAEALERAGDRHARLLVNTQSGRATVQVPAPSLMLDDGTVERRLRLLRPMERSAISLGDFAHIHWEEADLRGLPVSCSKRFVAETVSRALSAAAVTKISPASFRGLLFSGAEQSASHAKPK